MTAEKIKIILDDYLGWGMFRRNVAKGSRNFWNGWVAALTKILGEIEREENGNEDNKETL